MLRNLVILISEIRCWCLTSFSFNVYMPDGEALKIHVKLQQYPLVTAIGQLYYTAIRSCK